MWNKFLHNPFHIVKDYELRKLLWQSGSGTAVCKKYLKFRDTAPEKLTFPETQVDEPIWLFWNTGLEQAPEIVKTCYQSIKKYAGRQVVLLTENNVQNYINMPDYLNVEHYYKKTVRISLYTAVAAVINLVLNYIFIPYFGYVAAAYTTIVSYVVALILHTSYAKKLRPEIYPIKTFFVALMHISLFTVAFYVLKDQAVMRWALMIVYFFAMLFKERNRIVEFFPQLKRKR